MLNRLYTALENVSSCKWQEEQTTTTQGQGNIIAWNSPQSHHQSFNLIVCDIGCRWSCDVVIFWTSNSKSSQL